MSIEETASLVLDRHSCDTYMREEGSPVEVRKFDF